MSSRYWRKRATRYEKEWHKRCEETVEKQLAKHYRKALIAIKGDIQQLYATFAKDNGLDFDEARRFISSREFREWRMTMQEYLQRIADGDKGLELELNALAMRPRINRLEKLYGEILQELDNLGRDVSKSLRDFLKDAYKGNYYRNIFDFVKIGGMSVALAKLDNLSVEKVLAARWSGKNYSERIWKNTKLLSRTIKDTVANGVHRGLSIQQMSQMIESKMQAGYSNAVRLVRTEMNFVNNQAHYDSMKDAGIEAYEFIAVLDNRTSAPCRTRDGETYLLEEKSVGFNYPPLHARCRSTVAPFIEGVSKRGTRVARDKSGKNIDIPAAMKYKDYESVYIKKEKSLETWKKENHRGANVPSIVTQDFYQIAKIRSIDDFKNTATKFRPIVEQYTGRKSLWSGIIRIDNSRNPYKDWNCDIVLWSNAADHMVLHELIHSCSISHFGESIFWINAESEELAAQYLAQEISLKEGISIIKSNYDSGVNLIREFRQLLKVQKTDLEFATELIKQSPQRRWDFLEELISSKFDFSIDLSEYMRWVNKLEEIKKWTIPN